MINNESSLLSFEGVEWKSVVIG